MKKIIILTSIISTFLFQFYNNKTEVINQKQDDWDFTDKDFKDEGIRLLNVYDVFDFTKSSDSTIVLNGQIFQGWQTKAKEISDTLQLTEKFFIQDSLGNRTTQLLSYSGQNKTYFQLIITKMESTSANINNDSTSNTWFNYTGKLFIYKDDFQYFGDFLYTK